MVAVVVEPKPHSTLSVAASAAPMRSGLFCARSRFAMTSNSAKVSRHGCLMRLARGGLCMRWIRGGVDQIRAKAPRNGSPLSVSASRIARSSG